MLIELTKIKLGYIEDLLWKPLHRFSKSVHNVQQQIVKSFPQSVSYNLRFPLALKNPLTFFKR
jgi:hypothetical protein